MPPLPNDKAPAGTSAAAPWPRGFSRRGSGTRFEGPVAAPHHIHPTLEHKNTVSCLLWHAVPLAGALGPVSRQHLRQETGTVDQERNNKTQGDVARW